MKKRIAIIAACVVAAAAVVFGILTFMPGKIAEPGDSIQGGMIEYRGEIISVDNSELKAILCRYDAQRSLRSYFPYQIQPDELDVHLVRNDGVVHIILGPFYIWYESADRGAFAVQKGEQLKEELLALIRNT
jgi:hypothetical protein